MPLPPSPKSGQRRDLLVIGFPGSESIRRLVSWRTYTSPRVIFLLKIPWVIHSLNMIFLPLKAMTTAWSSLLGTLMPTQAAALTAGVKTGIDLLMRRERNYLSLWSALV
jgi:hypothetical protein